MFQRNMINQVLMICKAINCWCGWVGRFWSVSASVSRQMVCSHPLTGAIVMLCLAALLDADGSRPRASRNAAQPPCEHMRGQLQADEATLVTAIFRGDAAGLRDILAVAAADLGPCFADVVLPLDAPDELVAAAHALVDEAALMLLEHGVSGTDTRKVAFRVVHTSRDSGLDTGASGKRSGTAGGSGCVWAGYHVIMEDCVQYPDEYLNVARQVFSMSPGPH